MGLVAALTFLVWLLIGPHPAFTYALVNAGRCSSSPAPARSGWQRHVDHGRGRRGANMGVLFKDAEALEVLGGARALVVDKPGP